jgi:asparagine synthase (glutamine-hydrolysing)
MCGIAAIFSYRNGPPVDEHELLRIRDRMTSRGPDGAGLWLSEDRRIGLAHRRLSILDLSEAGAQPMFNSDGQLGIVFNGEIYNYRELRSQLEDKGFRFTSTTDTEVLLHLYAERGPGMLDSLRGMYAFALWDSRKKGLFLARDPYGIKPLYYADDGRTFRAASQVKALLAGGKLDTTPDPAGHVGFFLWGHVPDPHTLYTNIHALPAGSSIWLQERESKKESRFCNIARIFSEAGETNGKTCTETLSEALHDSVRRHLIADVPVGVFLSSGIDSTTIAALAAEEGGTLQTITLGFEEYAGTADDETPLAEEVARLYGSEHRTVRITRRDFENHRDHLFSSMDQPTTDGVNTYFVSLAAQNSGLKAALSGLGGDELFGGYPSFRQIPRLVNALRPLQFLNPMARGFRVFSTAFLKYMTSPKYAGIFEYGGSYGGAYLLRRALFMPWELPQVLDRDFARAGWQALQPMAAIDADIKEIQSARSTVSCLESCWYMRNQLLRDSDWAGMAHSLEIRVPLVDIELLRSATPWIANGSPPTKRTLLDSTHWPLPDGVVSRPKTGFGVPVREWLSKAPEVRKVPATSPGSNRGLRAWSKSVYSEFTRKPY